MYSTDGDRLVAGPLPAAVDAVGTAVEHLIKLVDDGAHTELGAFGLVEMLQRFETIRNTMPVIDRALIQHGTEQGAPAVLSERSMVGVLKNALRISGGEAVRRVRAAEHLADRTTMTGEPLPPIREHLSQAQRDGVVTPEQVALIDGALRKVKHCDPVAVETGEILLVEQAGQLGYRDLSVVAAKLVEAIDPDGVLPGDEAEHRLRRYFHLKQRTDGCWAGDFRLTPAAGQKLAVLLGPLMKPQTTTITPGDSENGNAEQTGASGGMDGGDRSNSADDNGGAEHANGRSSKRAKVFPDERTVGQRRHDALEAVLDAMLRGTDTPASGGTPATVLINIDWDDFLREYGMGTYADGTPVSAATVRDLADHAEIAWCFKNAKGAVLDLYRTRRIASAAQTLALYARDAGCSFPGCDVAPQYCERHHVIAWYDGGDTNLRNLTLVCAYHHHHFAQRGWQCHINTDGLPVWIPPKWIDPAQRPILNARITINNWNPHEPLDFTTAAESVAGSKRAGPRPASKPQNFEQPDPPG